MASEKNITMKEFNGTDYDTLYPKTKTGQVVGLQEQFNQTDKNVDNKILNFKNKNIEPIGTVKITTRTDLGNNWLKCNGASFSSSTYPELATQLPAKVTGDWSINSTLNINVQKIVYNDNNKEWIAVGQNSNNYPTVCTSSDLKSWRNQILNSANEFPTSIRSDGGNIVITSYTSDYKAVVYSAISTKGPWIRTELAKNCKPQDVYSYNGEWVICSVDSPNAVPRPSYFHTTTPTGSWNKKTIPLEGIQGYIYSIYCHNGTWVIGTYNNYCLSSKNPNSPTSWTKNVIKVGNYETKNVFYYKNYWISTVSTSSSNEGKVSLYYASTPDSTWNEAGETEISLRKDNLSLFAYENYIILGGVAISGYIPTLFVFPNLNLQIIKGIELEAEHYFDEGHSLFCYKNNWVACFQKQENVSNIFTPSNNLPNITFDKATAYIKAKDDTSL